MRIGIDARWIGWELSGIGAYTQELIRYVALENSAHEFYVYFHDARVQERTWAHCDLAAHPQFSAVMVPDGPFSLITQWRMPRLIRAHALDVFHATNFMLPFRAFPRHRRGPTACVVTIYDLIPLLFPEYTPRAWKTRLHPVFRRVMREVGQRADLIITISSASQQDITEHMLRGIRKAPAMVTIPAGVDTRFTPAPPVEHGEKVILYVGRMDPYKNVTGLINAFVKMRTRVPFPVRLRLIGPRNPQYTEVEDLIARHRLAPHIDWPGYVSDEELVQAYQQADIFVLPSLYEGFGMPVIEAMASGTPVICSNRASLPEVAGDAARLIDPLDTAQLADAICAILSDPAQAATMREKGLQQAAEFSWTQTARQTLAAYEQAAQLE